MSNNTKYILIFLSTAVIGYLVYRQYQKIQKAKK